MNKKLSELDEILVELQMDEYLNEDSLPKIGKARGIVNELVNNLDIPVVSVAQRTFCRHYETECIGNLCSLTPNPEDCTHLWKQNAH